MFSQDTANGTQHPLINCPVDVTALAQLISQVIRIQKSTQFEHTLLSYAGSALKSFGRFSNIVLKLTMPLNKRLSYVGRNEVDYWIRHGVIQILSLVPGLK